MSQSETHSRFTVIKQSIANILPRSGYLFVATGLNAIPVPRRGLPVKIGLVETCKCYFNIDTCLPRAISKIFEVLLL